MTDLDVELLSSLCNHVVTPILLGWVLWFVVPGHCHSLNNRTWVRSFSARRGERRRGRMRMQWYKALGPVIR